MNCGQCANAVWTLTPTGRIKKGVSGQCGVRDELLRRITAAMDVPCIAVMRPYAVGIWPEYNATACPKFTPKKA